MRFYADVHMKRNHVVVTDGTVRCFKKLSDIPADAGDELYVDTISTNRLSEYEGLLVRGVRIFYLKRTDVLKEFRSEKSDESDAKALARIPKNLFRELTKEELELRKLLYRYNNMRVLLKLVKQLSHLVDEDEVEIRDQFNQLMRMIRRQKDRLAREADKKAREFLAIEQIAERLGINEQGCLYGRVALAHLLVKVDFSAGLRKILAYTGNIYPNEGKFNKALKEASDSLTISVLRKRKIKGKEVRMVLKTIKSTLKELKTYRATGGGERAG